MELDFQVVSGCLRLGKVKKVPAILEYIPYRKTDGTRARDEPMHGYFAGHGYAVVRVDMRGSGGIRWSAKG
ncbi:CocE/NonD family hydrolase [Peribacillus frigoritolerans]|nr:CocE/NonD family hydrolase [Peribacillus frigoritolerans]